MLIKLKSKDRKLPEHQRAMVDGYHFRQLDVETVSSEVHRTVDAVYKALQRIRRQLGDCIERSLREEAAPLHTQTNVRSPVCPTQGRRALPHTRDIHPVRWCPMQYDDAVAALCHGTISDEALQYRRRTESDYSASPR